MEGIFQNVTVCNFCLQKNVLLFSVKREMPILFFVNCERTVLFSVKRDLDPSPLPPSIICPDQCHLPSQPRTNEVATSMHLSVTFIHLHKVSCTFMHDHTPSCTFIHLHAPSYIFIFIHLHAPSHACIHRATLKPGNWNPESTNQRKQVVQIRENYFA